MRTAIRLVVYSAQHELVQMFSKELGLAGLVFLERKFLVRDELELVGQVPASGVQPES